MVMADKNLKKSNDQCDDEPARFKTEVEYFDLEMDLYQLA